MPQACEQVGYSGSEAGGGDARCQWPDAVVTGVEVVAGEENQVQAFASKRWQARHVIYTQTQKIHTAGNLTSSSLLAPRSEMGDRRWDIWHSWAPIDVDFQSTQFQTR